MYDASMVQRDTYELRESVRAELDAEGDYSEEALRALVRRRIAAVGKERHWTSDERIRIEERVLASFRGLDILEPLLADPDVTEIMANGHEALFYEKQGRLYRYPHRFESKERLEDIIQSIVSKVNRTVNEASPIVDARLPDGSRVCAVLPPIALCGPTLSIRKFPEKPITLDRLLEWGALTPDAASFLQSAVRRKKNIFVSGGTGSGKTTMLNVLSQAIPDGERVVTIEDSAELRLTSLSNVVSLETRPANTEGKGEITIRQLLRAALRMRPNRIIVGEVRGAEALDMLQAMNTGHEGSMSTGHANSVRDMLSRLETMAIGGADLPVPVVRRQIASALHLIVHVSRMPDYSRKVTEIVAVDGLAGEEYRLRVLFARKTAGDGPLIRYDERLEAGEGGGE
ncbi:CpaF family protein [Paenibacillus sp.]|uniref:CpaF family protein n=1 Tax=Paenibacillus sp. TaxID=58172 RepID=UPI002D2C351D|nr:CpaF family protein [Paenibacillus sp.]HZG56029.1 CpaF family protein [Paenibacillus sp.]